MTTRPEGKRFKCPRCGGKYFGRHPTKDLYWCHNDVKGEAPTTLEQFASGRKIEKLCNWKGTEAECHSR